jgi:hypothetical protein
MKKDNRSYILLEPAKLNHRINSELIIIYIKASLTILTSIQTDTLLNPLLNSIKLITKLRKINHKSFQTERETLPKDYSIENNLLLFKSRLYVQHNTPLYTKLITEIYAQLSVAHADPIKIY